MIQNKQYRSQHPPAATDGYDIGRQFEVYVTELFNKDSFWLLDWQDAKKRTEYHHLDLNFPDLYLMFQGKKQYRFAVECKYSRSFEDNGWFKWASDSAIKSYKAYQAKFNIPVFVVIGIGGTPNAPENLFVMTLYELCDSNYVHLSQLRPYSRRPTKRFFYDTVQLKLF